MVDPKFHSLKVFTLFCYHVKTTLKGISPVTLRWFPHGSKKECTLNEWTVNTGRRRTQLLFGLSVLGGSTTLYF